MTGNQGRNQKCSKRIGGDAFVKKDPYPHESALQSADSSPESADSTTDFVIVGQLPVLNMLNFSRPIGRPTIAVS